jgi:hypothetical protein
LGLTDQTARLRVRNWNDLYENNRSRELAKTSWFPAPNDLSSDAFVELVAHEDGASHFGAWMAMLMVASRTSPRGLLVRDDGRAHTARSLARMTRLPESLISAVIERTLEIGLLENIDNKPVRVKNLPSQADAGISQASAEECRRTERNGTEPNGSELKGKEAKRTETDNAAAFRKSGEKAAEAVRVLPENQNHSPNGNNPPSAENDLRRPLAVELLKLRSVMAEHMNQPSDRNGELEQPSDTDLDSVAKNLKGLPIDGFCSYLRALPAGNHGGAPGGPRTWGWFISTARNFARIETPQVPTADKCRHGKPYHMCCNTSAENAAMTEAFA